MNKKLYAILGIFILVVAGTAFVAGRLLHGGVGSLGLSGPVDDGISILPAEELPEAPPDAEGLFVERQDNIIIVEDDQPVGDSVSGSPVGIGGGPKVEVLITAETLIYHDTTEPPFRRPSGDDPRVIRQTVEQGTLDDLIASQSLVITWGRKSGDRIVAEVLLYSDLGTITEP